MEKINGVPRVKVSSRDNAQAELLQGLPDLKSDVVAISEQNPIGKTQGLTEAANMLKLKGALEKQTFDLNKLYSDTGNRYDFEACVKGPIKLKEISISEIIKRLAKLNKRDVKKMDIRRYTKNGNAISDFKKGVLGDMFGSDSLSRAVSVFLDKIGQLFLNSGFPTIAYLCDGPSWPFDHTNYLIGIDKNNQMIVLSSSYSAAM